MPEPPTSTTPRTVVLSGGPGTRVPARVRPCPHPGPSQDPRATCRAKPRWGGGRGAVAGRAATPRCPPGVSEGASLRSSGVATGAHRPAGAAEAPPRAGSEVEGTGGRWGLARGGAGGAGAEGGGASVPGLLRCRRGGGGTSRCSGDQRGPRAALTALTALRDHVTVPQFPVRFCKTLGSNSQG